MKRKTVKKVISQYSYIRNGKRVVVRSHSRIYHKRFGRKIPTRRSNALFHDDYDKVVEWKQSYGIEHYNLNMAEEALFDNIERSGFLVQKVTPKIQYLHPSKRKYRYLTNKPGSKEIWSGHRSLTELDDWFGCVKQNR